MAEKYTPNKPKDAGLEARQKLGWWHAYRFLILRRISQLSIILMFLSGPIWQVWILRQLQLKHAFGYCAIDRSIDYR